MGLAFKNYDLTQSVWLVYYKKSSGVGDLTIDKIIDTLISWGWIDSLPRKIDEQRSSIRISPRNPKSNWSRVNKDRVDKLLEQDLMQPPGLKVIQEARMNGCWTALDDVENLICPPDMVKFLHQNKLVKKWESKARTYKRGFLESVLNSKRSETREKKFMQLLQDLA